MNRVDEEVRPPGLGRKVHRRRRRVQPGQAPGIVSPPAGSPAPHVRVIVYSPESMEEHDEPSTDAIRELRSRWPLVWVNVDGLGDPEKLRDLGDAFGLHTLSLEDVANVHQRPKVEIFDDHVFFCARMPHVRDVLDLEQVSIFFGEGFVLSFQEREGDCFDPVRERIRSARSRIRRSGSDYLAYALLDAIVDSNFPLLEEYGDRMEDLEEEALTSAERDFVPRIYSLRRELIRMRRATWPLRDAIGTLMRDAPDLVQEGTRPFLRDVQDHAIQLVELVESYREIATSLLEVYLSSLSNRMNEVMKVLTIIATLFIPLGFVASLYGMNFDTGSPWNMPELGWRFGYPLVMGVMVAVSLGMLVYFRRKGWIGGD